MPLQTGVPLAPAGAAGSGATVDGIRCDAAEQVAYHIHVHLAVFVGGASRPVPYGIGVVAPVVSDTPQGPFAQATVCYYWLHTQAEDGVIHVESPTARQYTLGDFFDIWRQPLGPTRVGPARRSRHRLRGRPGVPRGPARHRAERARGHPARRRIPGRATAAGGLVPVSTLMPTPARAPAQFRLAGMRTGGSPGSLEP